MRTIVKLIGWLLLFALFFSMMANPTGTADTLVNVGQAAGDVAMKVGTFVGQVANRLKEIQS